MQNYARKQFVDYEARLKRGGGDSLPSRLVGCERILADAREAEVTYFQQFFLFQPSQTSTPTKNPKGGAVDVQTKGYAFLSPWYAVAKSPPAIEKITEKLKQIADRFHVVLPGSGPDPVAVAARPSPSTAPRRTSKRDIKVRNANVTMGGDAPQLFYSAGGPPWLPVPLTDLTPAVDALTDLFKSMSYTGSVNAGFNVAGALWAVGVTYEHTWNSLGFRRGRLVRSISLTPGEQLEIQVRTWEKKSTRSSVVESIENNISTELTGTEKWVLATKMNAAEQTNASVSPTGGARGGLSLPIKVVNAEGGGNVGLSGNLSDAVTNGMDSSSEYVQELVRKSALSLKTARTNTVETSAEAGTEITTKQVIANTNRCSTVTYYFFEVVEDFQVTTQATEADLYFLVPLPLPEISPEWVLCHECELRRILPCSDFYAGFDGAKVLRVQALMAPALANLPMAGQPPGNSGVANNYDAQVGPVLDSFHVLRDAKLTGSVSNPPGPGNSNPLTTTLKNFGDDLKKGAEKGAEKMQEVVVKAGTEMKNVFQSITTIFNPPQPHIGSSSFSLSPFSTPSNSGPSGGAGTYAYFQIAQIAAPNLMKALADLDVTWSMIPNGSDSNQRSMAEQAALDAFFAGIGNVDHQFAQIDAAVAFVAITLLTGAAEPFAPVPLLPFAVIALLLALVAALEAAGFDVTPNDHGLHAAVNALLSRYHAVRTLLPFASLGDSKQNDALLKQFLIDQKEAARARVEYDRLACHIQDNWTYYIQAMWSRWPDVKVAQAVQAAGIPPGVTENSFRGFVGGRGAVRVIDLNWLQDEGIKWDSDAALKATTATAPELFTLPLPGVVAEPALGQCNACEDFIQQHRALDLQNKQAEVALANSKAEQARLEAKRFEARLTAGKLDDPTPFESDNVSVEVKAPSTP